MLTSVLSSSAEPSAVEVREAQRAEAGMGPSSDVQQDFQVSVKLKVLANDDNRCVPEAHAVAGLCYTTGTP
jgi:hypothetical protein